MSDFDLQHEVCAKAGITGRIISNPFAAEVIAAISSKPAIDVVKYVNDQNAEIVARAPATNWGLGTLNPLEASHIAEGERCLGPLGFKGLLITSSWHGRFLDTEAAFPFWEWAQDRQAPIFIHPPRVPIGHDQQMDQYKLDELVGRPFDTAMALARMILSGLFDRYPRLKIAIAHMGGGLLPGPRVDLAHDLDHRRRERLGGALPAGGQHLWQTRLLGPLPHHHVQLPWIELNGGRRGMGPAFRDPAHLQRLRLLGGGRLQHWEELRRDRGCRRG